MPLKSERVGPGLNRAGVTDGGQVTEWSSVAKLNSCPFSIALWTMLTFLLS